MTPRSAINFFRSRTGAFVMFLALMGAGYFLVNGFKAPNMSLLTKPLSKGAENKEAKPQVVETVTRDMTAFNPPKETSAVPAPLPTPEKKKQEQPPGLPPISLYAESPSVNQHVDTIGADYAPFGRLV